MRSLRKWRRELFWMGNWMNSKLMEKIRNNMSSDCKYIRHECTATGSNPKKRNNGRIRVYFEDSVGTERSFIMSDHPTRTKMCDDYYPED